MADRGDSPSLRSRVGTVGRAPRPFRGLSLVELMVGLTVGLAVAGGAATLYAHQVRANQQLLKQARLHQELRGAMDLVQRELRRARFWGHAAQATVHPPSVALANPYGGLVELANGGLLYRYSDDSSAKPENDTLDTDEELGFWVSATGVLMMQVAANRPPQPVTDPQVLALTRFERVATTQAVPLPSACATPCPATLATCPSMTVTTYDLVLAGHLRDDPGVHRELRSRVRLRNESVSGACP